MNNVFGENMKYPNIFKEYLIDAINISKFNNNIIYKNLDNLELAIISMKTNMYNINRMFKLIFRAYKKAKFSILDLKTIYHKDNYHLYSMKLVVTYKTSKWIMDISISNEYEGYLNKKEHHLRNMNKDVNIYKYDKYDLYVDKYYKIVNNINNNFTNLYDFYKVYIKFKDNNIFILKLKDTILRRDKIYNYDSIDKNISRLYSNAILRRWKSYAYLNNLYLEYEEIIKVLKEINNLLKERID